MAKQRTLKQIQDDIWVECKRIIRAKYSHTCYTCGVKKLIGSNLHAGHMIPKKYVNAYLKYDIRLLRPQCYNCNINLGGMGALFIENMRKIEGDIYVAEILADLKKKVPDKKLRKFYEDKLEYLTLIK